MGKRVAVAAAEHQYVTPPPARSIRKRKVNNTNAAAAVVKTLRQCESNSYWHENDDEDSSSNDTTLLPPTRNQQSSKHANNSSILLNSSVGDTSINESPKPVYTLHPSVVNGTILYDLKQKPWRLGRPIGKGNFGEIFLASDNITIPVTNENAKFVVKIEPHSNGPLFVEIHCLMNTAEKPSENNDAVISKSAPSGIPDYIASGSHNFGNARYRFLVLQRFDRDLHSLIKNCRVHQKSVLALAIQIVNVLENLHDKGYCHNDVKAQNLMISKCKYLKEKQVSSTNAKLSKTTSSLKNKIKYDEQYDEKQQTTDSGNSSEQEANDEYDADFVLKRHKYEDDDEEDEDFDDGATSNSNNTNSAEIYQTPVNKNRRGRGRNNVVEYSGSNPVRSCRRQKRNSIYEEMVKSHYLRPAKRISYSEFFNEDGASVKGDTRNESSVSSDDESEEFLPQSARRTSASNKKSTPAKCVAKRLTRRQEKLLSSNNGNGNNHNNNNNFNATTNGTQRIAAAAEMVAVEEERIFLIDFGLASKFIDNGVHRPFIMDQRRAHDGTLEFTSRDAHMGAHSRRSDLECLGYNLIFWSQGYLPWKDAAMQHQQEKVHRAKEYLMTDVREMLRQIYGKQVPKYLGEFLHQVGQLAYHERPDYARYRRIFQQEFLQLGYTLTELRLESNDIIRTCVRVKEEIENKNDIFEMNKHSNNALSIMKNLSVGTPFQESTLSNRVSPKNLRSKSDKKAIKKKKFSWAEILSQDPDQIARERAEKEFDREEDLSDEQRSAVRRYTGKPTYAILEIEQRLRMSGRLTEENGNVETNKGETDTEMEISDEDNDEEDDSKEADDNDEQEEEECDDDDDDDDDDENVDEAMEIEDNNECMRRTRKTRITVTKSNKRVAKTTSVTTGGGGRIKTNSSKRTSKSKTTTKTRMTEGTSLKHTTQNNSNSSKRSVANTRYKRKCDLVENGEFTQATQKYLYNSNGRRDMCGIVAGGRGDTNRRPPERRTRRCLIKTEPEVDEEAEAETEDDVEDESNSNFSPDMRSLFNVWKKFDNQTIYFRNSNAAATKHCKK